MNRWTLAAVALLALVLVGCNKSGEPQRVVTVATRSAPAPMVPPPDISIDVTGYAGTSANRQQQLMAYSHFLWLISEPATVQAHFERARDRCLNDAALNCILISGAANAGDELANEAPSAQLVVSLPHDQVAAFEKGLLAALPGKAGDVTVRQQSLQAENVTEEAIDIDRRIAQLTNYRDRLSAIAERSNVKADDLIQLEEKISEIQGQLDDLVAQKASVAERIHRERVSVTFGAKTTVAETERPLARAWDNSFEVLGESASTVFTMLIVLLPWLPVLLIAWLIARLLRRMFPRRTRVVAPAPAAAGHATAEARPPQT